MLEKKRLLDGEPANPSDGASSPKRTNKNAKDGPAISPVTLVWDGTPTLRRTWHSKSTLTEFLDRDDEILYTKGLKSAAKLGLKPSYEALATIYEDDTQQPGDAEGKTYDWIDTVKEFLTTIPGLLIGVVLNLFFSISFGQAFFPTSWVFPPSVPRTIGVQMWLFSTIVSQVVLTATSSFPMAVGSMMVENIPFMHVIANIAVKDLGMGEATFSTVFVTFSISTVVVGALFYVLGHFELGNTVYFIPKHVIVGCIGGIGIFLTITSIEVSTNVAWEWTISGVSQFFTPLLLPFWMASVFFALLLRFLGYFIRHQPMLPPLYFISIPFMVYTIIFLARIPLSEVHQQGWFFSGVATGADPFLMWELINFSTVNWTTVGKAIPTVLALTIFSLMHVPINIPSLSLSTGCPADMNKELVAHGYSNAISGIFGGLQNYLCYSTSVTYYKCKGGGKLCGYLLAALTSVFFFVGPSVVVYFPRCMAGCLLLHVGVDLTKEALFDSLEGFDSFEYGSVVAITIVMTVYGMTAGLELGVLCAALTFTLQAGKHVDPIRAVNNAVSLRSSRWRSKAANEILDLYAKHITVAQLQGHIFFGNATSLYEKIEHLLQDMEGGDQTRDTWLLILDFTLVLGIDSSAVERITKLLDTCRSHNVRLCFARGSAQGFPCAAPLTEKLRDLSVAVGSQQGGGGDNGSSPSFRPTTPRPSMLAARKASRFAATAGDGNVNGTGRNGSSTSLPTTPCGSDISLSDLENGSVELKNLTPRSTGSDSSSSSPHHVVSFPTSAAFPYSDVDAVVGAIYESPTATATATATPPRRSDLDRALFVADTLDDALAWCEEVLIREISPLEDPNDPYNGIEHVRGRPTHLRQLHSLCPRESAETVDKLLSYFEPENVPKGTVLWSQGDDPTRAVLLCKGRLVSSVLDDNDITETVNVGMLIGEYNLINGQRRQSTVTAVESSAIYSLRKEKFEEMTKTDPDLAFVLSKICLGYLGHRVMHVANRLSDGGSLPI